MALSVVPAYLNYEGVTKRAIGPGLAVHAIQEIHVMSTLQWH